MTLRQPALLSKWGPYVAGVALAGLVAAGALAERVARDNPYVNRCSATVEPQPRTASTAPARLSAGSLRVRRFLYVVANQPIHAYDIDRGHRLVQRIFVEQLDRPNGVIASPRTRRLFVPCGSNGPSTGTVLAFDLVTSRLVWAEEFADGADSGAVHP